MKKMNKEEVEKVHTHHDTFPIYLCIQLIINYVKWMRRKEEDFRI